MSPTCPQTTLSDRAITFYWHWDLQKFVSAHINVDGWLIYLYGAMWWFSIFLSIHAFCPTTFSVSCIRCLSVAAYSFLFCSFTFSMCCAQTTIWESLLDSCKTARCCSRAIYRIVMVTLMTTVIAVSENNGHIAVCYRFVAYLFIIYNITILYINTYSQSTS